MGFKRSECMVTACLKWATKLEAQGLMTKATVAWQGAWHENTHYTRKLICIKGYDVEDMTFHVLVWNERNTLKGDQCHI